MSLIFLWEKWLTEYKINNNNNNKFPRWGLETALNEWGRGRVKEWEEIYLIVLVHFEL